MREDVHAEPAERPTLVDLLRRRALRQPDTTAYRFLEDGEDEVSLTYGVLDGRARAVAAALRSVAGAGDRALLLCPPGLDFIAAFFGCLYAGVLAVPAYPPRRNRTDPRISQIASDSRATVALTTRRHLSTAQRLSDESAERRLHCLAVDDLSDDADGEWKAPDVNGESVAFLQYTSGSTLAPKGVMVRHANLLANLADSGAIMKHTPDSVSVSWLPHFHDMGLVWGILQPLYDGFVGCLLPSAAFLQRPVRWLRAISRYGAMSSGAPNFAWDLCANKIGPDQKADLDLRSWRIAFNGAETVRLETMERFAAAFESCGFRREALCPVYGLAEATLRVTSERIVTGPTSCVVRAADLKLNRVVESNDGEPETQTLVGCGSTSPGTKTVIVDPVSRRPVGSGEVGEIWVSGPGVALGYWNQPDETRATFDARTDRGEGPFLRTGDLGFLKDGRLFVTGRLKDLIIIRGLNHYPEDIELTVGRCHPGLRPGCGAAFSVNVGNEERPVIVHEVDRLHRNPDVPAIAETIVDAVTDEHGVHPHSVVLIKHGTCPKTTSGKIQRHACRDAFLEDRLHTVGRWDAPAPREDVPSKPDAPRPPEAGPREVPTESALRDWLTVHLAKRVGADPGDIDPRRPFAQFGLDSAAAVTLLGELEVWLGRRLSPVLIFNYPNVDALVEHLIETAPAAGPSLGTNDEEASS